MSTPTIAEAARQIAARSLSPIELTRHCLDRIAALDSTLHAFIQVTEERALADARAAEARAMAGALRGPLDGIPIAHKDIFDVAAVATTAQSRQFAGLAPKRDAAVVAGLAQAGAVTLGKLACYEHAFAGPEFDLPWPPARNPWNTTHSPAGSSSGTAVAVASGMILGGTGSDTGGSIRDPAAVCGVAGIKPTYGLCSRAGVLPFAWSLDHPGPLAWTAADCALLLQAMAGHDFNDAASARRPVPDFSAGIDAGMRGLRIGVLRRFHEEEVEISPATRRGLDDALDVFRALGAEVGEASLPTLAEYDACGWLIALSELHSAHEAQIRSDGGERYGSLLRQGLALGGMLSAADYIQAAHSRQALCRATAAAMQGLDLLFTAVQSAEAPLIQDAAGSLPFQKPNFTMPFNVTGQPAMSVCTGFGAGGLPLAMQLIARPFQEPTLLRAAHAYEQATSWRQRRPRP